MKLAIISGARPQFIKLSPLLHLLEESNISYTHIHSGQHYDIQMSDIFFEELDLKPPDINLGVGSCSHAIQTAKIMMKLDNILKKSEFTAVLIPGDTNTTLAGALTAAKKNIPVIHLEAGLRSYDRNMPEETNRIITDHCSDVLLAPTIVAKRILLKEGFDKKTIFVTGDTMLDIFIKMKHIVDEHTDEVFGKYNLPDKYALLTLHRQENTEDRNRLKSILNGIINLSKEIPVIFPVHPRTRRIINEFGITDVFQNSNVLIIPPLGYIDFMVLVRNAKLVMTDSGGLQKESAFAGVPCITLRDNTEWTETIENNWNKLAGPNFDTITELFSSFKGEKNLIRQKDVWKYYGSGKASQFIVKVIKDKYSL